MRLPRIFGVLVLVFLLLLAEKSVSLASAQISPEEHASHHPGGGANAGSAGGQNGGMMGGGMAAMMDGMMKKMGVPPRKELYPTLMSLPSLTPDAENTIRNDVTRRMAEGLGLITSGLGKLNDVNSSHNFRAGVAASGEVRDGAAIYASAMTTLRAIEEGQRPSEIGLLWFKSQMNLGAAESDSRHLVFGLSHFHFFVMALLVAFAAAVFWVHALKMRRAADLLARIAVPGRPEFNGSLPPEKNETPPPVGRTLGVAFEAAPTLGERWEGTLNVGGIFQETPTIKTFRLIHPEGRDVPFAFLPGQFVSLGFEVNGKVVKRAYSISSSPTQRGFVDITVKRQEGGALSPILHDRLRVGDALAVTAPSGVFTFTGSEAPAIVLIAGGVGLTPLMSIVRNLTDRCWSGRIALLHSCKTPSEILFRAELEGLQAHFSNFQYFVTVSSAEKTGWTGLRGRLSTEAIRLCIPDIASTRVHLCGPLAMMDRVREFLLELGVPKGSIKSEAFGPTKGDVAAEVAARGAKENIITTTNTVGFSRSGKTAFLPPDMNVLEAAESVGVEIDNSCRSGTCGLCKVRLTSGTVSMAVDESLSEDEKQRGMILACQAKSTGNIVVEA